MIDETWLNPEFAESQLVVLAVVFLASLIILPLIFGAIMYLILSLVNRFNTNRQAAHNDQGTEEDD